jgi:hypothetical protein
MWCSASCQTVTDILRFWGCVTVNRKVLQSFVTSETTCQMTRCLIPEELYLQHQWCDNARTWVDHICPSECHKARTTERIFREFGNICEQIAIFIKIGQNEETCYMKIYINFCLNQSTFLSIYQAKKKFHWNVVNKNIPHNLYSVNFSSKMIFSS